jgi:hypothetical protein
VIHEYALEPELVASLTERSEARYYYENLGLGQPRLVSRYPKRWKALALEAVEQKAANLTEKQRATLVELIQRLSEPMVRRGGSSWDSSRPWLENAEQEHDRKPFRGILARANPRNREEVLIGQHLDEQSPIWAAARGATVPRQARSISELVLPLLRCCGVAIFIDPYFGPENLRHRRSLEAFLESMIDGRTDLSSLTVEVHTGTKSPAEFFKRECENQLSRCIPAGMRVTFRRWTKRLGGEDLHNRYILTDLGGLIFSHGLDEGKPGETDDVNVMDRHQYAFRWEQYTGPSPAFDLSEEPVVVVGTRRIPR